MMLPENPIDTATTLASADNVLAMPLRPVKIHHRDATAAPESEGTCDVDADGMRLHGGEVPDNVRYLWLDVDVGEAEPVRALGEVLRRTDPTTIALEIKFKHLFPDHKRRLMAALRSQGR